MRADARANRQALIEAARRVYAARGPEAPYSSIAEEAGVGIGTLYRHFPTQDDLVIGLVEDVRDRVVAVCETHLPEMAADPEPTWSAFVSDMVGLYLGAFLPQVIDRPDPTSLPAEVFAMRETVMSRIGEVLDLARQAGLVKPDVTPLHFQAGIGILTRPLPAVLLAQVPDMADWLVGVYVDGLRPRD
jgi:AcrR family transcriptional regulator